MLPLKAILTGMHGTVAPALAHRLIHDGIQITSWNRDEVPTAHHERVVSFFDEVAPDWFFQIATGSPDWIAQTALLCHERDLRFLFTGSVSVFGPSSRGPYPIDAPPDATDDYGRYKIECEHRIREANPNAIIARLGWQIGDAPGSNNMVDFVTNQVAEKGRVEASNAWVPSCAFLHDSVEALYHLMKQGTPGTFQLEGNPGLSFYGVLTRLKQRQQADWDIVETTEPNWDNRMVDERVGMRQITENM